MGSLVGADEEAQRFGRVALGQKLRDFLGIGSTKPRARHVWSNLQWIFSQPLCASLPIAATS